MQNIIKKIKKLAEVPGTPRALGMKGFSEKNAYTWEDWERDAKISYPVRYFLSHTMPTFLARNITRPYRDAESYIRYRFIQKHHIVNLQNEEYKYGYLDVSSKILYAVVNLLNYLVEVQHKGEENYAKFVSWQKVDDLPNQHETILEVYRWFKHQRPKDIQKIKEAQEVWHNLFEERLNSPSHWEKKKEEQEAHENLIKLEKKLAITEDEYLMHLMRLRLLLWH